MSGDVVSHLPRQTSPPHNDNEEPKVFYRNPFGFLGWGFSVGEVLFSLFSSILNPDSSKMNLSSPGSGLNSNSSFFASLTYEPSCRRIAPFGITTMADSPLTGHLCSQNPQPLHLEATTTGRRYPSTGRKTIALYGQISSQMRQSLF